MGGSLELGKITAAVWLKNNWNRAGATYKMYLLPAVAMLMLITSMGIFGYLSKAHNDQNLVSGDIQSKILIYDEKIKTSRDNIEADRKQLRQMDEAVDQIMSRSTTEGGADKANAVRKSQSKDRSALARDIEYNQKQIATLNDQAAPIRAENRKVEAEVGPIKYIAKLIYSDNPDANILEKAVTWVIMIIVAVFDPLALVLILAAQQSIRWARGKDQDKPEESVESWFERIQKRARFWNQQKKLDTKEEIDETQYYIGNLEDAEPVVDQLVDISPEDYYCAMGLFDRHYYQDPGINDSLTKNVADHAPDDGLLTKDQIAQIRKISNNDLPTGQIIAKELIFTDLREQNSELPTFTTILDNNTVQLSKEDPRTLAESTLEEDEAFDELTKKQEINTQSQPSGWMFTEMPHPTSIVESTTDPLAHIEIPEIHPDDHLQRLAKNLFMSGNADQDERVFHAQHQAGEIDQLPWLTEEHINNMPISDGERKHLTDRFVKTAIPVPELGLEPDNVMARLAGEVRGFGIQFPTNVKKGDMFLRVDRLPSILYKYNGVNWIEVDKSLTDNHAYDEAYIDHLIAKIDSGEYDPELLSDAERDSIERRLQQL